MKPNRKEGGVYMPIAVVSGADRNIGLEIVKQFLQRGWKVFAGRYLMELPLLEELQEKYPQQLKQSLSNKLSTYRLQQH